MLNKLEKYKICETIAQWEWRQGSSSSEASAYGQCALKIQRLFNLENNDWDLAYARALEIHARAIIQDSSVIGDDFFDALCSLIVEDYSHVIDLCESKDMNELLAAVKEEML